MNIDGLELELRQVPGVAFVSVHAHEDGTPSVQAVAESAARTPEIRSQVDEIVSARLSGDAKLEFVSPPRERVEVVGVFPTEDRVVVALRHGPRNIRVKSRSTDPADIVGATLAALAELGADVPFRFEAAAAFEHQSSSGFLVMLDSNNGVGPRYGVARGPDERMAMVRATLSALNRHLDTALTN
ncbi:MAG: hypothetical protein ACLGHT_06295 [Acidimicrobiia bacterium]